MDIVEMFAAIHIHTLPKLGISPPEQSNNS